MVANQYYIGKFETGTERLVGVLSKRKTRWLPLLSEKHQKFIADKETTEKQMELITAKKGCQILTRNYYYKLIELPLTKVTT